jgi:adenine-specific DNA-methyltransferase
MRLLGSMRGVIKLVVKNTEELGILTERVICEVSKIDFNTKRVYNNIVSEFYNDISKSVNNVYKNIKFTDHLGNMNKEYDFMGVNDTKKKVIKVSIKTIMKGNNKICPQKVGQCSLIKFNEKFNTNGGSMEEIKIYFYDNLECMLNEYLKNTFCCDNTLIYKFKDGLMYDVEKIRIPKFMKVIFSIKNDIKTWNESNTVYVLAGDNKYTLGEIQIHKNRNCIKYRFNNETLIKLIKNGFIENLKIREYNLEHKYDISVLKEKEMKDVKSLDVNYKGKEKVKSKGGSKVKSEIKEKVEDVNKFRVYKSFNYIGSKKKLLQYLEECMELYMGKSISEIESFGDYFCGTGIVSYHMIQKGVKNIITNDIQHYAYVISSIWSKGDIDVKKVKGLIRDLNSRVMDMSERSECKRSERNNERNFIYNNYTEFGSMKRMYLTKLNGLRVDYIRQEIERLYNSGEINEYEYHLLIKVLLYGVTAVSNTASVYGAYLKKYKACALKTLLLDDTLVENLYDGDINHKSYNMDISRLLDQVESTEVCYIDSPYNTRKYDDNYHLLETISKYDYPKIKGKTGLRDTNVSKSKFCSKVEVKGAFDDIYSRIKSKYIFVSYSSEGLVSKDDMIEMMKKYWTNVVCYEKDYQRFKSNRNNQMSDGVIEYLFAGTKK